MAESRCIFVESRWKAVEYRRRVALRAAGFTRVGRHRHTSRTKPRTTCKGMAMVLVLSIGQKFRAPVEYIVANAPAQIPSKREPRTRR